MRNVVALLAFVCVTVTLAQLPLPAPRAVFPPDSSNVPNVGISGQVELKWSEVRGAASYHLKTYSTVYREKEYDVPGNTTSFVGKFWYNDEPRWWITAVDAKGNFGYTTSASFLYGGSTKCRCACP